MKTPHGNPRVTCARRDCIHRILQALALNSDKKCILRPSWRNSNSFGTLCVYILRTFFGAFASWTSRIMMAKVMHELKPSNTRHEFVPRWTQTTRISDSSWYHHRFPPETLPALINRLNHSLFGCWKSVALSVGFRVVTPLLRFQSLSSFSLLTSSLIGNTSFAFQFEASENHAQNVYIQTL